MPAPATTPAIRVNETLEKATLAIGPIGALMRDPLRPIMATVAPSGPGSDETT